MRRPQTLGLFLAALALSLPARADNPRWQPVSAADLSDDKPRLEPQAGAEILDYRIEVDDTRQKGREEVRRIRYKIYDPARATSVTRFQAFWGGLVNPDFEIKARLTLPDGSTRDFDNHDLKERDVVEEGRGNGAFGALVRDNHDKVAERFLAVTGVTKDAVLDVYEDEPNTDKTSWTMRPIQREDAPIRHFEYESRYTPAREIIHRAYILNPCGGKMTHDDKAGILRFEADDLPPIRHEPYSPPETYYSLTIIETSEYSTMALQSRHMSIPLPASVPMSLGPWAWSSTGRDYQDSDKGYPERKVRQKAEELTAGVAEPRERAKRLFDFTEGLYQRFTHRADLQDTYYRYSDSSDDLIDLDKVDSTVFRDADFHYLLVALLRSAGFECHSVFHPLRSSFPFSTSLVSDVFLERSSVAIKIGDGWVLCDPCSEVPLAFGELGWEMEGQPALMALPRRQAFLEVPPMPAEGTVADTKLDVELGSDGDLKGTCVRTLTGHAAHVVRERLYGLGQEEWGRIATELLDLQSSSCDAVLQSVDGVSDPDAPITIRASVRWPAYAAVLSDRMTFVLSVWDQGRAPFLAASERSTPVFFRYEGIRRESITVKLPDGSRVGALPKPIRAESGSNSYSLAVGYDPSAGTLQIDRSLRYGEILIPVAEYPRARDWYRRVSAADQIGIVIMQ